ncbi:MAG TPA: multidrug efflux RND transporter permease subunit [Steroidobacteraceae bacterium]|nr:multidrug efflux RND transporter permease subunit [Steroidobacteraceae bacterium]
MISDFCIRRPIFASVLSIVVTLAGAAALVGLPIEQYPPIAPPQVTVSASFPGADAQTVAQAVAAPIETQVNGADNMLYMQSTSSSTGQMTLTVYFQIGTDPDTAQVQVQNRVNIALPQLPDVVQKTGVRVEKRSSSIMMLLAVYAPDGGYDVNYVANYANLYVLDAVKRVPGANQATLFGAADNAMRIWLSPDRMAARGITSTDIQQAIAKQNQQFGAGSIGQSPTSRPVEVTVPVVTEGRFNEPAQFDDIILRTDPEGAAIVRLGDVGRAEEGLQNYMMRPSLNGKPAVFIAVYQQPGSNALQVAQGVRKTLENLKKSFPPGIDYEVSLDTTKFVTASIDEVVKTLLEAVVLVVLVVYVFLQNLRATLIPTIAVVVSIVGTFVGMTMLGFSVNLLTLFGMVLSIGIVVDDAIVVIEAVEANMKGKGLSARDAAFAAMHEVSGPVVAIVLVLAAVFVPTAFLGGTTGVLYKQFAMTVVISVILSGFVALTLTPALAALLLDGAHGHPPKVLQKFNEWFERLTESYTQGVRWVLKRAALALAVFAAFVLAILGLFKVVPGSFVPPEDQGFMIVAAILPDSASLDRSEAVGRRIAGIVLKHPAAKYASVLSGYSAIDSQYKTNSATVFVSLKDFAERKDKSLSLDAMIAAIAPELAQIEDAYVIPINPPPIPGLGMQGGFEMWVQDLTGGEPARLAQAVQQVLADAKQQPALAGVNSTFNPASRQLSVKVDREKAETLGAPIADVYGALQSLFGSLYVSQYNKYGRVWQVVLQAEPEFRNSPEDLRNIYVRGRSGEMVPLDAVTTARFTKGPDLIPRFNGFPAAKINGGPAPGYSSGQAIATMEKLAATLPEGYGIAWSGQAYEEKQSGGASAMVFVFGLVMVFLILAAQYESWSLPGSVITAVPFGLLGALLAVWLRGMENDVYFQIGLVTLIGLAAKNAILIVEFAVLERRKGLSIVESAVEGAKARLRPIVMTSLAFTAGAIPLAIASGAGSASRHSIGTGVIGGMVGATTLALFFAPLFYVVINELSERFFPPKAPAAPAPATPGGDTATTGPGGH